jgi:hypothetical protein
LENALRNNKIFEIYHISCMHHSRKLNKIHTGLDLDALEAAALAPRQLSCEQDAGGVKEGGAAKSDCVLAGTKFICFTSTKVQMLT